MGPLQLTFDVSERIKSGEALSQTAWLFLPEQPVTAKAVLLCLPGGTYDKRYWHLEVPGHPVAAGSESSATTPGARAVR